MPRVPTLMPLADRALPAAALLACLCAAWPASPQTDGTGGDGGVYLKKPMDAATGRPGDGAARPDPDSDPDPRAELQTRLDALRAQLEALDVEEDRLRQARRERIARLAEVQVSIAAATRPGASDIVLDALAHLRRHTILAHVLRGHFDELARQPHAQDYLIAFSRFSDAYCRRSGQADTGFAGVTLELGLNAVAQALDPQVQMSVLDTLAQLIGNPERALVGAIERDLALRDGAADAERVLTLFPDCDNPVNQRLHRNIAAALTGRAAPFADPRPRDRIVGSDTAVRPVSVVQDRVFGHVLTYRAVPDSFTPDIARLAAELGSPAFHAQIEGRSLTHHLTVVRAWRRVPYVLATVTLGNRFTEDPAMATAHRALWVLFDDDPGLGLLECQYVGTIPGTYRQAYYWYPHTPAAYARDRIAGSPILPLLRQIRDGGVPHCPLWYEGDP